MPIASRTSRLTIILVVATVAILVVLAIAIALNPLRRSDDGIRNWLLSVTPLGTTVDDIQLILNARGWKRVGNSQVQPPPTHPRSIEVELGGYQGFPWYIFVRATWEVDDSGKLRDIKIGRYADSF
jgi:hypothetical protein